MAIQDGVGATATKAATWRRSPWRLTLSVWLLLVAFSVAFLWHLRREALFSQGREMTLLSAALTDDITRGLRGAQEGLHAVRAELRDHRLPLAGPEARRALHTRADLMPLVDRLWLVGAGGQVLADSDATPAPDAATFAPPLGGLGADAMAVSRPFVDPPSGQRFVALAVRYDGPDGTPGWIVAGLPASALLGAFSAAAPGADVRMDVFRSDGVLLASANEPSGSARAGAMVDGRTAAAPVVGMRGPVDGTRSLADQRVVPLYGLQVVVSRDLGAILAGWHAAVAASAAALLLLLVVMLFALGRVQLAERRRGEAQRALQAQLGRAGRLEALGTLAGGVAHDFNNVLAGIVGYAELAQDAAPAGGEQARHLDRVLQAALRGKSMVERILMFSRGGAKSSVSFEIEAVVEEVLALLSSTLRPGIVLERDLEAAAARVRGDPAQAFEAIMNLCTNALQSMPEGGRLAVRTERIRIASDRVLSHSRLAAG
ncbi:MAG TPA: histidine kinase dimerization/phospho-acceptor domain-containing protein, partial [Caldimonas sp.]|nr:histidine kinase dimerization/phospho-acceptor domain-containing protein [Caldimonas sp.]